MTDTYMGIKFVPDPEGIRDLPTSFAFLFNMCDVECIKVHPDLLLRIREEKQRNSSVFRIEDILK